MIKSRSFLSPVFGLGFFFIPTLPVEAVRPLVQPPATIQISHLAQPQSLKSIMDKKDLGLDLESSDNRKLWLDHAHDYISFRAGRGRARTAAWLAQCDSKKALPNPVFCALEKQRQASLPTTRVPAERINRREAIEALRAGEFTKLAHATDQEVISTLNRLGEASAAMPIAKSILSSGDCVSSNLATSLAGRLEELFPAPEAVEAAKGLYKKSANCGNNLSAGKAAFRLGLILVWQNHCADVPEIMAKAESIPDASQFHARAKFWRYQCAVLASNETQRKAAQEALNREFPLSFQNLAVNGDSDIMKKLMTEEDPQVAFRSATRPDLNDTLRAAEALVEAGSPHLAAEILDRNVNELGGMEPEARLYIAVLLNRIGYSLPAFKILSDLFKDAPRMTTLSTMKLMFPVGYLELASDKKEQVDPYLILSLIRQESAFNASARSIVGARGLMQVMPATARSIASVRRNQLFTPAVNVRVGTKYFLQRLHQFDGDVELTLAAYNAGVNRVDSWRKRYPTDNKILFLDFIPFKETRDYVTSILRNYYWYTKLYSQDPAAKSQAIMRANAGLVASDRQPPH